MNRNSTSDEQALKASTFISSNSKEGEAVEEIEEIEMDAVKMATGFLETMMTTTKAEGEILTYPRKYVIFAINMVIIILNAVLGYLMRNLVNGGSCRK